MFDISKLSLEEKIEFAKTTSNINIIRILSKESNRTIKQCIKINPNTPTFIKQRL